MTSNLGTSALEEKHDDASNETPPTTLEDRDLDLSPAPSYDNKKEAKRIIRKADIRLLPILGAMYSFCLIDRTNIANARVAGAGQDLGLSTGDRYSITTMVFFIPYVLLELPSNIVLRKVGSGTWLPLLSTLFGVVSMCCGFTNTWEELLGCRVVLGALEAGFYPGAIYLLSCWYLRYEVQKRFAIFFLIANTASGLGNVLGYGLSQMDGVGGLEGWRWIFIIEGLVTVAIGVLSAFILIPFPEKATKPGLLRRKPFLTKSEAAIIETRLEEDTGDVEVGKLTWKIVFSCLTDWKMLEWAWLYLIAAVVTYSFSLFLPIILENYLGYSRGLAQVLSFPPYVVAAPWIFIAGWVADRYRARGWVIIFNCTAALVGLVLIEFVSDPHAKYAGTFLGVSGGGANVPTILAYMHNNIVGQQKRSVASAVLIGASGISGIIAANIFRQQDAPQYRPALITVIVLNALSIIQVAKNFWLYSRINRKADRGEILIENQRGFRLTT